jgi:hypothetical protein
LCDLKDLSEGQVSFIANSFLSEANEDFDNEYMSLARNNYETAYELFAMLGGNDWYQIQARQCQAKLAEIEEIQ